MAVGVRFRTNRVVTPIAARLRHRVAAQAKNPRISQLRSKLTPPCPRNSKADASRRGSAVPRRKHDSAGKVPTDKRPIRKAGPVTPDLRRKRFRPCAGPPSNWRLHPAQRAPGLQDRASDGTPSRLALAVSRLSQARTVVFQCPVSAANGEARKLTMFVFMMPDL
jgi:hypothetical protein